MITYWLWMVGSRIANLIARDPTTAVVCIRGTNPLIIIHQRSYPQQPLWLTLENLKATTPARRESSNATKVTDRPLTTCSYSRGQVHGWMTTGTCTYMYLERPDHVATRKLPRPHRQVPPNQIVSPLTHFPFDLSPWITIYKDASRNGVPN